MRTLELFCGTKSFSKVSEKLGNEVVTLDNTMKFNPTILQDILDMPDDYFDYFDIVWASPPCTAFSVASIGKNWTRTSDFTEWKSKAPCKNGDPCHISAPRGSRTGTQGLKGAMERGVIPEQLFMEIFEQIKLKEEE